MLNWIITSSVLVLVVILIRTLFNGRLDPRIQYALWIVVLVRLLVPINFFSSDFSILRNVNTKNIENTQIPVSQKVYFDSESEEAYQKAYTEFYNVDVSQVPARDEVKPTTYLQRTVSFENIVKVIVFSGMAIMMAVFLISNTVFYLKLRRMRKLYRKGRPSVYVVSRLASPCLFGTKIYIREDDAEDEETTECIITHETTHYKHLDHIWSVLRMVALCLHWYNPLVWIAVKLSKRDSELAADTGAISKLGEERRVEYGETLLSMVVAKSPVKYAFCCATTMNSGKKGIKERIKMIANQPKVISITFVVAMLTMLIASCGTFTAPDAKLTHIKKQLTDCVSIDADIEYKVKSYNSYEAKLYSPDADLLQKVFFKGEKAVDVGVADEFESYTAKNGDDIVNYHQPGLDEYFVFHTDKYLDREYESFFHGRGGVYLYRDNRFSTEELDFMSKEDALSIAKDYMSQLGIKVADYKIYSFDAEYLQSVVDDEYTENEIAEMTDGELKAWGPFKYSKDDEFYLIVPTLAIPDGSSLTVVDCTSISPYCEIKSDLVWMTVDNKGLSSFMGRGIYRVTGTRETAEEIITVEDALSKIQEYYKVKDRAKITHAELAYVPHFDKKDTFVLRPTWVFDITYERANSDSAILYRRDAVDAVTGEVVDIDKNGY